MVSNNQKKGPCIPNLEPLIRAGINPATGLPVKFGINDPVKLKENIRKELRINDKQIAINRGKWYNLPCNLTSQDVESMLYEKGQLAFFYNKELDEFFFLPFALSSDDGCGLDLYGRYKQIRPVAYVASAKENKKPLPIESYLSNLRLNVKYTMPIYQDKIIEGQPIDLATLEKETERHLKDYENSAVILFDYSPQSNPMNVLSRRDLNEPLLDLMSEMYPYMRTSLILGSGVTGLRVQDGDQSSDVVDASNAFQNAALSGMGWIPITSQIELQELTGIGKTNNAEEYMIAYQSLDNFRYSLYGIPNGGVFEKKAQELNAEAAINGGPTGLVMEDYVVRRQNFCNICNAIWGTSMRYEPSESIVMTDLNGDGVVYDRDEADTGASTDNGGSDDDNGQV